MVDLLRMWSPANRTRLLAISWGLVAAIAFADWWHPTYISLGFLYVFPVMLASGFVRWPTIIVLAFISAALQEAFGDLPQHESIVRFVLAGTGFLGIGLFVSEAVRNRVLASRHVAELEEQARLRRDAEEQFRALVHNSPAAIVTIDADGRILMSNDAARELFVPIAERLDGEPIGKYMPSLQAVVEARGSRAFHTWLQGKAMRGNGDVFLAGAWFSTYLTSTGPRLAAIVVDFSDDLRSREDHSLDHVLRHTRIVMGAVAHEIRNVAGAVAIAHRNLSQVAGLAENEDFRALGTLIAGLERLANEQLRPLSAIEAGTVDLGSLLDELRVVTEPALAEEGIVSSWPPTTGLPLVQADRQGLMQVFLNLVRNSEQALQSSAHRELRVGAAREAGRVVVRFADSGPGVRRPEQLFRPFAAPEGQPAMGLFVSRAIARSFGGDVLHEETGEGACFAVTLRCVPASEEAAYA